MSRVGLIIEIIDQCHGYQAARILKLEMIHFVSKNIKIQMRIQNDFGFFLKKLT